MRKIVIAGTYAQYRDWLNLHRVHQRAAPYVDSAQKLLGECNPEEDEIVLVGTYHDNPAYQSSAYRWLVAQLGRQPSSIAI